MTPQIPLTRDLVMVGGGHAHALVLRMWAMNPLPGVRITVINPAPTAPYSGMLPGHIAGHYAREDLEIDLVKLCRFAGARVVLGHATGIDRKAKTVQVEGHPDIAYDVASIDIGIHGEMPELAGFAEHGVGAKPLDRYVSQWNAFLDKARQKQVPPDVAVIGGGIAGAELALAMHNALNEANTSPRVSLIEAAGNLTGTNPRSLRRLEKALNQVGVELVSNANVVSIEKASVNLSHGEPVPSHFTVASAGARPHDWVLDTDLPLHNGFIKVDANLNIEGDLSVFAAGDCCHMSASPRPKAGVYAVRSAPVLLHNLKARLAGGALKPFRPQRTYLKLISLGRKSAIAEKGPISFSGDILWRWKDHIDRKFMRVFLELPKMEAPKLPDIAALGVRDILNDKPLCAGCGAKVGSGALEDALCELPDAQRADVLNRPGDDAAILQFENKKQVVTVDHLRSFDEDPYRMARIATVHALGDIWAMGAEPQSILVSLVLPRMNSELQSRTLREIMAGVQSIARPEGAEIVGGHTSMGAEMTIGLTATGLTDTAISLDGALAGDALILTRPIGSGTLLAAEMAGEARGYDIAALLEELQRPQGHAAKLLGNAHAMTDVTGFGLAGHLWAMCQASECGAQLDLSAIPTFAGAIELNKAGHRSSIYTDNSRIAENFQGISGAVGELLFDPQTSGGLLAAVSPTEAEGLLRELRDAGYTAALIGYVTDQTGRITCSS